MQLQKNKIGSLVVGKGMLGRAVLNRIVHFDNCLFFTSGVSNSSETDEKQYLREENLLKNAVEAHPYHKLIYFSTVSVYDPFLRNRNYIQFKLRIENFIKENCDNYLIVRAPNVVGSGGNPNTLINFFVESIRFCKPVNIWANTERNFLGVDHLMAVVEELLMHDVDCRSKSLVDILYPISFKPEFVFNEVEFFLNIKGRYSVSPLGESYLPKVDSSIVSIFQRINIPVNERYINFLLNQYYR